MSLNVPPVTGKTPGQCAQEARTILKSLLMMGEVPQNLNEEIRTRYVAAAKKKESAYAYRIKAEAHIKDIETLLSQLDEVAKRRKPNEIRAITKAILTTLARLSQESTLERSHLSAAFDHFGRVFAVSNEGAYNQGGWMESIKRAYAHVQAIPVNAHAPIGREESTIRAITSILKVYHGIDVLDGSFVDVETPELPVVVMHVVEKPPPEETLAEEGKTIDDLVADEAFQAAHPTPYNIRNKSGALEDALLRDALLIEPYNRNVHPEDAQKIKGLDATITIEAWVQSQHCCSLEVALAVLRFVRAKFSDPQFRLVDGYNQVIAVADRRKPVAPGDDSILSA